MISQIRKIKTLSSKLVFGLAWLCFFFTVSANLVIKSSFAAEVRNPAELAQKEYLKGTEETQKKDYHQALSHFIKASILDNSEEKYFHEIGKTLYQHFNFKTATESLNKLVENQKSLFKYFSYAGWAAIIDGKHKKAVNWLENAAFLI